MASRNMNIDNQFQRVIAPVLAMPQIFGIFPLTGIFSKNLDDIKFKLLSFKMLFTSLWFISAVVFLGLESSRNYAIINLKSIGLAVFYFIGISTSFLFLRIARKWNELLHLYKEIDEIFCNSPYRLSGWSFKKQIRFTTFVAMTFAFCQYSLSWYSFLHDRFVQAKICKWEVHSWFIYIASFHLGHIYRLFPVNIFSVSWAEFMHFSFIFLWNYVDLFIMIMSMSIATKFKMINERLEYLKGRVMSDIIWDEIRCHYNTVCDLNDYVDDLIGSLICVACFADVYAVCLQLLNITKRLPYTANKIYFWFTTIYLTFRAFTMFFVTASVNDESVKPLAVFRTIPTKGWSEQLQRLSSQIQHNSAALSGKKFFIFNRGIIISIIGTIITYELVLLQFDGDKIASEIFTSCGHMGINYTLN